MTIIDRPTIEALGLRTIPEILRFVPGMYVRAGLGLEGVVPVVSYHGLTDNYARRMEVLVDGRTVYLPPFNTVLWDDLPVSIDDVERIEISRGPNAASYGGNAVYGTVNILTRAPGSGGQGYALGRVGQDQQRELFGRAESSSSTPWRVSAGSRNDGGFDNLFDTQRHAQVNARAELALPGNDALDFEAGGSEGWRQQGYNESPVDRPRKKRVLDSYAQLEWHRGSGPDDEWRARYYAEQHVSKELDVTLPLPFGRPPPQAFLIPVDYTSTRNEVECDRTVAFSAALKTVIGARVRRDRVDAPVYFGGQGPFDTTLASAFTNWEWRATRSVLVQQGLMVERQSHEKADIAPRTSLSYLLGEGQSLRASISLAHRTPAQFERSGNYSISFGALNLPVISGNPDVRSERVISRELGYHLSAMSRGVDLDVKLYRESLSSLILETPAGPPNPLGVPSRLDNTASAHVSGLETEFALHGRGDTLRVNHAYAVVQSSALGLRRTLPRNLLGILYAREMSANWRGAMSWYVNSGLPDLTGAPGQLDDPQLGYAHRLDLSLTRLAAAGNGAQWTVGVQNVGGNFVEWRPRTTMERRYYAELRFQR